MQGRHWGYNFFCLSPAARRNPTRIITEFQKKAETHSWKEYRFRTEGKSDHLQNICLCGDWPQVGYWGWKQNGHFGMKTNREQHWIFDAAILLEINIGAERWMPEEWYVTTLPRLALSKERKLMSLKFSHPTVRSVPTYFCKLCQLYGWCAGDDVYDKKCLKCKDQKKYEYISWKIIIKK